MSDQLSSIEVQSFSPSLEADKGSEFKKRAVATLAVGVGVGAAMLGVLSAHGVNGGEAAAALNVAVVAAGGAAFASESLVNVAGSIGKRVVEGAPNAWKGTVEAIKQAPENAWRNIQEENKATNQAIVEEMKAIGEDAGQAIEDGMRSLKRNVMEMIKARTEKLVSSLDERIQELEEPKMTTEETKEGSEIDENRYYADPDYALEVWGKVYPELSATLNASGTPVEKLVKAKQELDGKNVDTYKPDDWDRLVNHWRSAVTKTA